MPPVQTAQNLENLSATELDATEPVEPITGSGPVPEIDLAAAFSPQPSADDNAQAVALQPELSNADQPVSTTIKATGLSLAEMLANEPQLQSTPQSFKEDPQSQVSVSSEVSPEIPQLNTNETSDVAAVPVMDADKVAPVDPVVNPIKQFDLQAAINLQAAHDSTLPSNVPVVDEVAATTPEDVADVILAAALDAQSDVEAPPAAVVSTDTPLVEPQDKVVTDSQEVISEEVTPEEVAPTITLSQEVAPEETPEEITVEPEVSADARGEKQPEIEAAQSPELIVDLAPSNGSDPLLEAMRLMQEVGVNNKENQASPAGSFVDTNAPLEKVENVENAENAKAAFVAEADAETSQGKSEGTTAPKATSNREVKPQSVEPEPVEPEYDLELEPDEKSGETARALLDMMSASGGAAQPQERALAADTLLQLVPRMPERDLVALSERVGMMDEPPALLVNKLINNRSAKVAQPLLEGGQQISDQDLLKLISKCDVDRLTMVSKRRKITSGVCDALISRGEASVYLTLVRNPGASLSHDAFIALCEIANHQQTLQAPLATRGDTPPPIAFELFWSLPVELRRYVLSRFLTDSATLDKILKIAQSVNGDDGVEASGNQHFPPRRKVDELVEQIVEGRIDAAVETIAKLAEIHPENARRIVSDPDGEPLTVALKMLGISRINFAKAIKLFGTTPAAPLSSERDLQELQAMFDGLSFNKARTLMKYWDWAIEKTGPYARRAM